MARTSRSRGKTPFSMKSGNKTSFKAMGSSSPVEFDWDQYYSDSNYEGGADTQPSTTYSPSSSHYADLHEKRSARGFDEARAKEVNEPGYYSDPQRARAATDQYIKDQLATWGDRERQVKEGTMTKEEQERLNRLDIEPEIIDRKTPEYMEQWKRDYYGPGYQGDSESA